MWSIVGHRKSYRCNFKATSEESVTDCDGHTNTHIYMHTYLLMSVTVVHLVHVPQEMAVKGLHRNKMVGRMTPYQLL